MLTHQLVFEVSAYHHGIIEKIYDFLRKNALLALVNAENQDFLFRILGWHPEPSFFRFLRDFVICRENPSGFSTKTLSLQGRSRRCVTAL